MQSKILSQKPIFNKNGVNIIDLTTQVIEYNSEAVIINIILVDEEMEMRPDLVSYGAYGIVDYWDLILKFNGISNPFSIAKGQYLFIPDLSYITSQIKSDTSSVSSSEKVRNQYIDQNKKSNIDPSKVIYDQMLQNLSNQISKYNLPPNISEPGKQEITIENGVIYLGGKD
jgi:hypothetical protein